MMKVIVTGCSGFIGMHVSRLLLERGNTVIGVDNMNDYYEPTLKEARLAQLKSFEHFTFHLLDIADRSELSKV